MLPALLPGRRPGRRGNPWVCTGPGLGAAPGSGAGGSGAGGCTRFWRRWVQGWGLHPVPAHVGPGLLVLEAEK